MEEAEIIIDKEDDPPMKGEAEVVVLDEDDPIQEVDAITTAATTPAIITTIRTVLDEVAVAVLVDELVILTTCP